MAQKACECSRWPSQRAATPLPARKTKLCWCLWTGEVSPSHIVLISFRVFPLLQFCRGLFIQTNTDLGKLSCHMNPCHVLWGRSELLLHSRLSDFCQSVFSISYITRGAQIFRSHPGKKILFFGYLKMRFAVRSLTFNLCVAWLFKNFIRYRVGQEMTSKQINFIFSLV